MEERKSFLFYRSFWSGGSKLKPRERLAFYLLATVPDTAAAAVPRTLGQPWHSSPSPLPPHRPTPSRPRPCPRFAVRPRTAEARAGRPAAAAWSWLHTSFHSSAGQTVPQSRPAARALMHPDRKKRPPAAKVIQRTGWHVRSILSWFLISTIILPHFERNNNLTLSHRRKPPPGTRHHPGGIHHQRPQAHRPEF